MSTSENTFSGLSVNDHACGGRSPRTHIKGARIPEGSWPLQASPRRHPNMAMNRPLNQYLAAWRRSFRRMVAGERMGASGVMYD